MSDEYIKKSDAYRIAVHGTDPDVAYKIQQLQPEKVIAVPESFLDAADRVLKNQPEIRRLLTGLKKCDIVEVEE